MGSGSRKKIKMEILIAILTLGSLGLLFGIGLAIASKKLAVKIDHKLEMVSGLLPGANCGACGGAGCFGFAEDLLSGKRSIDACKVSEEKIKEKIAQILGQKLEKKAKRIAVLHCFGGSRLKDRFIYDGIKDCVAANQIMQGAKECVFGCLGYGSCMRICPFDAIKMSEEGLPIIDKNKCKACNKCVEICPKKIIRLGIEAKNVYVACSSHSIGKEKRAVCPVGCICCKLCEKACPVDAIHVIDNLAVIDYEKCISCGKCVEVCPMKTIHIRS